MIDNHGMTIDEELLVRARAAEQRLAGAERDALLARAEYHTAIRRMHLAGGSLREIAAALSLSHQRVQQIVEVAGGSWWQRVWRTRKVGRDAVCTFCGRPPSEVAKLIAGPNLYICDACVARAEREVAGAKRAAVGRCSFCGERKRPIASGPGVGACAACLRTCREILDSRAS